MVTVLRYFITFSPSKIEYFLLTVRPPPRVYAAKQKVARVPEVIIHDKVLRIPCLFFFAPSPPPSTFSLPSFVSTNFTPRTPSRGHKGNFQHNVFKTSVDVLWCFVVALCDKLTRRKLWFFYPFEKLQPRYYVHSAALCRIRILYFFPIFINLPRRHFSPRFLLFYITKYTQFNVGFFFRRSFFRYTVFFRRKFPSSTKARFFFHPYSSVFRSFLRSIRVLEIY